MDTKKLEEFRAALQDLHDVFEELSHALLKYEQALKKELAKRTGSPATYVQSADGKYKS